MAPYVCSEHTECHVDHHGKGCRACILNAERRLNRRRVDPDDAELLHRVRVLFDGADR